MSEPVRVGVVGCGVIGNQHLTHAARLPELHVAAIAEPRDEPRAEAAEKYAPDQVYAEAAELIADPAVEVVVLALPTNLRHELGLQVLQAGKHLLTEKPAAMNARELRELIAARGDHIAGCCSCRLSHTAQTLAARRYLRETGLGELRRVHCRVQIPAPARRENPPPVWRQRFDRNGGGILVNWGPYDLDFLFTILDWQLRPRAVSARWWPAAPHLVEGRADPDSNAEAHVVAMVHCDGGEVLTYERAEFAAHAATASWELQGSEASLRLDLLAHQDAKVYLDSTDPQAGCTTTTLYEGSEDYQQHAVPLVDFADAIRSGTQPSSSLERSLIIQQVFDAVYESARTGQLVEIP